MRRGDRFCKCPILVAAGFSLRLQGIEKKKTRKLKFAATS